MTEDEVKTVSINKSVDWIFDAKFDNRIAVRTDTEYTLDVYLDKVQLASTMRERAQYFIFKFLKSSNATAGQAVPRPIGISTQFVAYVLPRVFNSYGWIVLRFRLIVQATDGSNDVFCYDVSVGTSTRRKIMMRCPETGGAIRICYRCQNEITHSESGNVVEFMKLLVKNRAKNMSGFTVLQTGIHYWTRCAFTQGNCFAPQDVNKGWDNDVGLLQHVVQLCKEKGIAIPANEESLVEYAIDPVIFKQKYQKPEKFHSYFPINDGNL